MAICEVFAMREVAFDPTIFPMGNTSDIRRDAEGGQAMPSLLVLDDEAAIADLVAEIFRAEGMEVSVFYNSADALATLADASYDLAIIDVMMPGMDGFEFCRRLKATSDIPVIFLTAKDEEIDIVVGFALGADDYVTKPFKPRELVARVKARLRKNALARSAQSSNSDRNSVLSSIGIDVDTIAHKAFLHDCELSLTPKEFAILTLLLAHKGEPISAKDLYEQVWEESACATSNNTIMVHIRRLRQKLAEIDSSVEFIETAWGVGYRIPKG